MKYNEAIDMILDGGEAYRKGDPIFRFSFQKSGDFMLRSINNKERSTVICFERKDIIENDWIVEKDGVVYEECPKNYKHDRLVKNAFERPGVQEAYLEILRDEMLEKIEMLNRLGSLHEKIEGDWLEKKMLCFMRRHFLLQPNALQFCKICRDKDCPFCYKKESNEYYICSHGTEPCEECAQKAGLTTKADTVKRPWQENKKFYEQVRSMRGEEDKPKQICTCTQANGHTIACHHCVKRYIDEGVEPKGKTPDGQQILYTRACNHVEGIGGIEKCPICTPIKEQPREKVTEEELADLINTFVSLHIAASLETKPPYKARTQAHDIFLQLKQKLTYLISLQEK